MPTATCERIGVRDIRPDAVYLAIPTAVSLFGVCEETARQWCAGGRLATMPRSVDRKGNHSGPYRCLGSDLLALMGQRQPTVCEPSETQAERQARAKRNVEAVRKLAKEQPCRQ